MLYKLSKSILTIDEVKAVENVILNDGYLGMGTEVKEFENDISIYLNIDNEYVTCVNTGTSALQLAIESVIIPGDEVLVPSFTFLSSFQAIKAAGGIPISCEIYEDSLTINIEDCINKVTPRTKVIMPVHYASNTGNLDKIQDFAKKYNLRIVEDAAHAFGCSYKNKKIGSFGDIICFSFDGIKNITSGEGGAIISFDKKVNSFVKDARLLSIEKDTEKRYEGKRSWDFDVKNIGYRFHMSNIFASIGRVQLRKLDSFFAPKRKSLYKHYRKLLSKNNYIILQNIDENCDLVPHIFPIRVLNNKRDLLQKFLEKNNIPTGIHYKPNHLLTYFGDGAQKLKITENIYKETLSLPLHPDLNIDDIEIICKLINTHLN
jgi:dTDP-4-amino-4,6-dideoxygalactose transaminase